MKKIIHYICALFVLSMSLSSCGGNNSQVRYAIFDETKNALFLCNTDGEYLMFDENADYSQYVENAIYTHMFLEQLKGYSTEDKSYILNYFDVDDLDNDKMLALVDNDILERYKRFLYELRNNTEIFEDEKSYDYHSYRIEYGRSTSYATFWRVEGFLSLSPKFVEILKSLGIPAGATMFTL